MEKRALLAIILSSLVLLIWSSFMRTTVPPSSQVIENKTDTGVKLPAIQTPPQKDLPTECLDLALITACFVPDQAQLKEVIFKEYQKHLFDLRGLYLEELNPSFKTETLGQKSVFLYEDAEKSITQELLYSNSNYSIELRIKIRNKKDQGLNLHLPFVLAQVRKPNGDARLASQEIVWQTAQETQRLSPWKDKTSSENIQFIALRERYFCAILQPQEIASKAFIKRLDNKTSAIGLWLATQLPAQQEVTLKFLVYIGPQDQALLKDIHAQWQSIVNYGFFDPLSKLLLKLLHLFYSLVHNWGLAIILLSLCIFLLLFPLLLKQMRSVKEMQILQPKIEELRKLYKDNPQKLNKEIMELYKEHKINPLGGCLPLLLQLPIFISLYQALLRSLELKGANFLWIKDLSEPDRLFLLPVNLPVLGNEFNLLPIFMAITMFLQQKLTSKAAVSNEQQKMMLILFPIMFGIIFYHMPAGLVLYWFINSLLMFIYQLRMG